jgi:hypothetical protein
VLRVQRLCSRRERGRVGLQEVLIRTGLLKTAGTTPIPTVATMASTGETTDSLRHQLQGTGYLASCSQHLCHHFHLSHQRRWWRWRRRRGQEWGIVALPVGILTTILAMALRVMAHSSAGTPVTGPKSHTAGPQVHL